MAKTAINIEIWDKVALARRKQLEASEYLEKEALRPFTDEALRYEFALTETRPQMSLFTMIKDYVMFGSYEDELRTYLLEEYDPRNVTLTPIESDTMKGVVECPMCGFSFGRIAPDGYRFNAGNLIKARYCQLCGQKTHYDYLYDGCMKCFIVVSGVRKVGSESKI